MRCLEPERPNPTQMYSSPFRKWHWPEQDLVSSKPKTTSAAEPSRPSPENETSEIFNVLPAPIVDEIGIIRTEESDAKLSGFLAQELTTPKLARIHDHLWLAGLTRPARSLHRQCLLKRDITITEDPNEHLVWKERQIFLKPLPPYLFRNAFWNAYLLPDAPARERVSNTDIQNKNGSVQKVGATKEELYKSACGMLLSYTWLIKHPSDLRIAHTVGLIPAPITWASWNVFKNDLLDHFGDAPEQHIDLRYTFGELRLTRLSLIYRIVPRVTSPRRFIYGYMSTSTWYQEYFKTHFAWLIAVFAYFTVVLSAMQVGLATNRLKQNVGFQRASFGVVVLSIVTVAVMVTAILLNWGFLFAYSVTSTRKFVSKGQEQVQRKLREEQAPRREMSSSSQQPENQV